eukprot:4119279-Pleurochrysis_carterae.AAC.1
MRTLLRLSKCVHIAHELSSRLLARDIMNPRAPSQSPSRGTFLPRFHPLANHAPMLLPAACRAPQGADQVQLEPPQERRHAVEAVRVRQRVPLHPGLRHAA